MRELHISGLVKSKPVRFSRAGLKKVKQHLKKAGWQFSWLLVWQQFIQFIGFFINLLIPGSPKRYYPAWKIAKKNNIPLFKCRNINSRSAARFISAFKPDLIISAYFNQILKPDIIAIPRLGVLNVHPGWLPAYRGAMTYFWVLKNGEEKAGVSVHWIDAGIDTGELVARRSFKLEPGATQQGVLVTTAIIGARLLKQIARKLIAGKKLETIPISHEEKQYYPMPGKDDFNAYFRSRRYFRIREVLGFLLKKIHDRKNKIEKGAR